MDGGARGRAAAAALFRPAIAVLDRLSFARKFIVIALLLAGPLAIVAGLQSSSASERIAFTRRERKGLEALQPVARLLIAAQRHRIAVAGGAPAAEAGAPVEALLADERYREDGPFGAVRARWAALATAPSEAAHGAFAASLLELMLTRIGNEASLVLDPDLESYWLANALVEQAPELAVAIGAAAAEPGVAPAARQALLRARAARLTRAARAADAADRVAPAAEAAERVAAALESPAPGVLAPAAHAALTALQQSTAAVSPRLDGLLARRQARLERDRAVGLAATAAAALILGYLFVALYLSIRRSMRALAPDGPEPGTPELFVAPGRDELGLIAEAFQRARGEQRALREQLRRADKLASIGQLAAGTAHELNEPIAAILGFAQLAQKCPGLPAQADRDLDRIAKAALHAREIIKQLLLFARQATPQRAPVDLNQVVREGLDLLQTHCERAGVAIARELADALPPLEADATQLRQVVLNLVVNALQASPRGGEVRVSTSLAAGHLALRVQDRGSGMSEEVRKNLFLPFYSTKDVGQGTGLGLSVVHGIVTAHGGAIEVESAPERGTRIEVRLPVTGSPGATAGP